MPALPDVIDALFQTQLATVAQQPFSGLLLVGVAFAGGVVSSLLPCTLGMLPLLVGSVSNITTAAGAGDSRRTALLASMAFVLGTATVTTALGLLAGWTGLTFGTVLGPSLQPLMGLLGLLCVFAGLMLLGVFYVPLPSLVQRLPATAQGRFWSAYTLGLAFALTASPCGTPFLTGILALMTFEKQWTLGAASLFAYAVGQGMLLVLAGMMTGVLAHLARLRQVGGVLQRLSGGLFVLMGLLLMMQALRIF